MSASERARLRAEGRVNLTPRWDGSHVLGAWTVVRDGSVWRPWFDRSRAAFRGRTFASLSQMHLAATALLAAPEGFAALLGAVAGYDADAAYDALGVPAVVVGGGGPGRASSGGLAAASDVIDGVGSDAAALAALKAPEGGRTPLPASARVVLAQAEQLIQANQPAKALAMPAR